MSTKHEELYGWKADLFGFVVMVSLLLTPFLIAGPILLVMWIGGWL